MASPFVRWAQAVSSVGYMGLFAFELRGSASHDWLLLVGWGVLGVIWTGLAVWTWLVPTVEFFEQGIKLPRKPLTPWSEVAEITLGGKVPWPSASKIVFTDGRSRSWPTLDCEQLAGIQSLIPPAGKIRSALES